MGHNLALWPIAAFQQLDLFVWIIDEVVVPAREAFVEGLVLSSGRTATVVRPTIPPERIALVAKSPVVLKGVWHQYDLLRRGMNRAINTDDSTIPSRLRISRGRTKGGTFSQAPCPVKQARQARRDMLA
jgi:hypothetical protein